MSSHSIKYGYIYGLNERFRYLATLLTVFRRCGPLTRFFPNLLVTN